MVAANSAEYAAKTLLLSLEGELTRFFCYYRKPSLEVIPTTLATLYPTVNFRLAVRPTYLQFPV